MLKKEAYTWANSGIQPQAKILYVVLRNLADPISWEVSKPFPYLAKAISYKPVLRSKSKAITITVKQVRAFLDTLEAYGLVTKLTTGNFKKGDLPTFLLPMAICPLGHEETLRDGHGDFQAYTGLQPGDGHEETNPHGHGEAFSYRDGHEGSYTQQGLELGDGHLNDWIVPWSDPSGPHGHGNFQAGPGLQPGDGQSIYNLYNNNNNTCTDSFTASDKSETAPEEIKKVKPKKVKAIKYSEDDLTAANWFKAQLEKSYLVITGKPYTKKINVETWADHIRLIRTVDKKSHAEICALWQYARHNARDWYKGNILSPSSLRKYWDKLELEQAQQANKPTNQNTWSNKNEISNEISKQLTDPAYALTKW